MIAGSLHPCCNAGVHQDDAVLLMLKRRNHSAICTVKVSHAILRCRRKSGLIQPQMRRELRGLQLMEDLEQLKVLENGYRIKVIVVDHCAHGVDEPQDVASVEAVLCKLGLP